MPRFDAASRDTDKFTRKIHFPGPRIEVRGDTVRIEYGVTFFVIPCSDAVSRKSRRGAPLLFLLCHELDPASRAG